MAMTDGHTTWIGADSVHSIYNGDWVLPVTAKKWFPACGWMVGLAGSSDLRHSIAKVAAAHSDLDALALAAAIWAAHMDAGFKPEPPEGAKPYMGSLLLLAKPGRLVWCNGYGDATDIDPGRWMAIGCGEYIGIGALCALTELDVEPIEAMEMAVRIAGRHMPVIKGFWSDTLSPVSGE